jgi:aspartate dehydrogenase
VGGLGSVGMPIVKALTEGIEGLSLTAVSARGKSKAAERLNEIGSTARVVELEELAAHCDVVVECLPPNMFDRIARPAIEYGRVLMISSVGQLLAFPDLRDIAERKKSRIVIPSGAIAGLDGLLACSESVIHSVRLTSRKPPAAFQKSPGNLGEWDSLRSPVRIFAGDASEANAQFPANTNVAAALAFAGIGHSRTTVEIWVDPTKDHNSHLVEILSDMGRITVLIEAAPSLENAASSRLAASSLIATLRKLTSSLVVGT